MHFLQEPTRPVGDLSELFSLDEIEIKFFKEPEDLFIDAGCWAPFLKRLTSTFDNNQSSVCDLSWQWYFESVVLEDESKIWKDRYNRWVEVQLHGQRFVIGLFPTIYRNTTNSYVDHRFVVASSQAKLAPLIILFGDNILGDGNE